MRACLISCEILRIFRSPHSASCVRAQVEDEGNFEWSQKWLKSFAADVPTENECKACQFCGSLFECAMYYPAKRVRLRAGQAALIAVGLDQRLVNATSKNDPMLVDRFALFSVRSMY